MLRSIKQQARSLGRGLPAELRTALERVVQPLELSTFNSLLTSIDEGSSEDAVWLTWLLARLKGVSETQLAHSLWRVMHGRNDDAVVAEAIRGLAVLAAHEGADELERLLEDMRTNQDVRLACIYALGHSKSKRSLPVLAHILKNKAEVEVLRGMAAEAIGLIGKGSTDAETALVAALEDSSYEVVSWAAFALAALGDRGVIPYLERARERLKNRPALAEIDMAIAVLHRSGPNHP